MTKLDHTQTQLLVTQYLLKRFGKCGCAGAIGPVRRLAGNLHAGSFGAGNNWCSTEHCLYNGKAETFVLGWKHERTCSSIESCQFVITDPAELVNPFTIGGFSNVFYHLLAAVACTTSQHQVQIAKCGASNSKACTSFSTFLRG